MKTKIRFSLVALLLLSVANSCDDSDCESAVTVADGNSESSIATEDGGSSLESDTKVDVTSDAESLTNIANLEPGMICYTLGDEEEACISYDDYQIHKMTNLGFVSLRIQFEAGEFEFYPGVSCCGEEKRQYSRTIVIEIKVPDGASVPYTGRNASLIVGRPREYYCNRYGYCDYNSRHIQTEQVDLILEEFSPTVVLGKASWTYELPSDCGRHCQLLGNGNFSIKFHLTF